MNKKLFIIRGTVAFETYFKTKRIERPIDQGGLKALILVSIAYCHLCQTNVTPYHIADRWESNPTDSYAFQERFYKNISDNDKFNLTKDGSMAKMICW